MQVIMLLVHQVQVQVQVQAHQQEVQQEVHQVQDPIKVWVT